MTELTNQACGLSLQSVLPRITKKKKKEEKWGGKEELAGKMAKEAFVRSHYFR